MIKLYTLTLLFWGILSSSVRAQLTGYGCGTVEMVEKSLQAEPWRRAIISQASQRQAAANPGDSALLTIPVVIHIMHNYGSENIAYAQVLDAVRIINEDFQRLSRDTNQVSATFRPIQAKVRVQFKLARLDPQGNCTIGVTRTASLETLSGSDAVKRIIVWDTRRYLNIWVVASIASGAGAYAYYPGSTRQENEGIVCRASQFGSTGQSSNTNFAARTLTHEIGHYFNLAHTWGSSNNPGLPGNCAIDDGVGDTPNTKGTVGQGCNLRQNTCGEALPDNVENYMDYSNCGRMFTLGQGLRMRSALRNSLAFRNNLWSAQNLIVTGLAGGVPSFCAPRLNVGILKPFICQGDAGMAVASLQNSEFSLGTQLIWQMPGARNQADTNKLQVNPIYDLPGTYAITAVARNTVGRDSVVMQMAFRVRPLAPTYAPNDSESFADLAFPVVHGDANQAWENQETSGRVQWNRTTLAGRGDNASLRLPLAGIGRERVGISTPTYDLETAARPIYLEFDVAAARRNMSGTPDTFYLYVSTNCGRSYAQRLRLLDGTSTPLYTTTRTVPGNFVPNANEWGRQSISLGYIRNARTARFRFEVEGGTGGSAIYIDNVKVRAAGITATAGVKERRNLVYPNPAYDRLYFDLASSAAITIADMAGKQILATHMHQATGTYVDISSLKPGLYVCQLVQGDYVETVKVQVE